MAVHPPPPVALASVPPPDPADRFIHVLTPQPGVPVRALIVGNAALGVYVHWLSDEKLKGGGRTVPHTVPDDTCPICVERNQRPRWHGYLAAWNDRVCRYYIIDLTVNAVQSCPKLSPASGIDLRGMSVLLRRNGISRNSPVVAELVEQKWSSEKIPADFDVCRAMMRLWGLESARTIRLDDLDGRE